MTKQSNVISFCILAVLGYIIASTEGLTNDIKKPNDIRSINCYECESHVPESDGDKRNKECEGSTLPKKYLQTRDTGMEKQEIEKDASIVCQIYVRFAGHQGLDFSLHRSLITERHYGTHNFSLPSKPGDKTRCFKDTTVKTLTQLSKSDSVFLDCACITDGCNVFSKDQLSKEFALATYVQIG